MLDLLKKIFLLYIIIRLKNAELNSIVLKFFVIVRKYINDLKQL